MIFMIIMVFSLLYISATHARADGNLCFDRPHLGSYQIGDQIIGTSIQESKAYMIDNMNNLFIIDISDPMFPVLISENHLPISVHGFIDSGIDEISVVGTIAYIALGFGGIAVVDVSDFASPTVVAQFITPDFAYSVFAQGTTVYVAGEGGLHIIDAGNPSSPVLLGSYATAGQARNVVVDGDLAYVGLFGTGGIQVVDIADPASAELLITIPASSNVYKVSVVGSTVSSLTANSGMQVFDLSDPALPVLLGEYDPQGSIRTSTVVGTTAYISAGSSMHVVDFGDPASPVWQGSYDDVGWPESIVVSGHIAYLGLNYAGLQIIDVSDCPPCAADISGDDGLNFLDISAFLTAFGALDQIADFEADGNFNFLDVSAFLAAFAAGCP